MNKKEDKPRRESCSFCKSPHFIEFTKLTLLDKMQFICTRGLCHGCLRWGHLHKDCRQQKNCTSCSGPHPTLLHADTAIGWGVIGVVNPTKNEDDFRCSCHRIASLEVNPSSGRKVCHFALKMKVKEIFQPVEVIKMFETDFHETTKMAKPSPLTI